VVCCEGWSVMKHGLLWRVVCQERWSVKHVVSFDVVCYERVCHEHGLLWTWIAM